MKILVTAGNTVVPIDKVRSITNVFTGRTGARMALRGHSLGHDVTLLTSHPEAVNALHEKGAAPGERWRLRTYTTFDDLAAQMADLIKEKALDVVIHCAAVSDYRPAGVYAPIPGTRFVPEELQWKSVSSAPPSVVDVSAGKVKSDEPELWLRLLRTPKLVDLIRSEWGFAGLLVKFKLEVGIGEDRLLEIAERSRVHSAADLTVANTLEGANEWAYVGPISGQYQRVSREDLPDRVFDALGRMGKDPERG